MDQAETIAQAALRGDVAVLDELGSKLLIPRRNNFVERPWGGARIRPFKRFHPLPDQAVTTGLGLGESFEIAAFAADREAAKFPSCLDFADGSWLSIEGLLSAQGARILGAGFVSRRGACFPLLPKILDIQELLSVQGHPPGNTEAYIIIDAEPGATIRLGFSADMDGPALEGELSQGLRRQRELLAMLPSPTVAGDFQRVVGPWLRERQAGVSTMKDALSGYVGAGGRSTQAAALLGELKTLYWRVLDSMNSIAVEAGQVIHNSTPRRLLQSFDSQASAEVHALGNPEGLEVLALEVRRPGPTYRAWDNVRFPMRDVDVAGAIRALNLRATRPGDFVCELTPVAGRPGVFCSVDSEYFRIEHLRPAPNQAIELAAAEPYCLHVVAGEADARDAAGRLIGSLGRGDSALVPVGVGSFTLETATAADLVRVTLPSE